MALADLMIKSLLLLPLVMVAIWLGAPLGTVITGWVLWCCYCLWEVIKRQNTERKGHWSDHMRGVREKQADTIAAAREEANMPEVYKKLGERLGTTEGNMEEEEDEKRDVSARFSTDQVEYLNHLILENLKTYEKTTTTDDEDDEIECDRFITKSEKQFRLDMTSFLSANVDVKVKLTSKQREYLQRLVADVSDDWEDSNLSGMLLADEVEMRQNLAGMLEDE